MDALDYLQCFLVALIGWALHIALKIRSLQKKANSAKQKFDPTMYFREDYISMMVSILTILLFLFLVDEFLAIKPSLVDYVKIMFSFIGYTSSDVASRFFSVVNKKLNIAIEETAEKEDKQKN